MALNELSPSLLRRLIEAGRGGLASALGTQAAPGPLAYMAQGGAEGVGSGMGAVEALRNVALPGTAYRNREMQPMQKTWQAQPGYPQFQLDPASPYHPLYAAAKTAPAAAVFAPASLGAGVGGLVMDVGGAFLGAGGADVARQKGASAGVQGAVDVAGNIIGPGALTSLAAAPVLLSQRAARKQAGEAAVGGLAKGAGRVADMSIRDMHEYGLRHGVANLAPSDEALWRNGLEEVVGTDGAIYTIPGGARGTEPFTYYDLLHIKQQGINPNTLPTGVHRSIHDRIIKTMQADGTPLTDERIANQMIFSLMSANNPLTANELGLARMMVKSPQDMEDLGGMIPWRYSDSSQTVVDKAMAMPDAPAIKEYWRQGKIEALKKKGKKARVSIDKFDALPVGAKETAVRNYYSNKIVNARGLQAGEQGGLGATGSLNYTYPSEFAQMMKDRPDFFRFDPARYPGMNPDEQWQTFVNELSTQVRGLQAKTASFGSVWQSPETARTSAVDRWMAKHGINDLFESDDAKRQWISRVIARFNAENGTSVRNLDELQNTRGGPGYFSKVALDAVSAARQPKRLLAVGKGKQGPQAWNPAIPKHYQTTPWVYEPENVVMMSPAYEAAIRGQSRTAEEHGHEIFAHQWYLWDKMRQRLEPHEIMFPGLEKLPPMPLDELREVGARHSAAGYKDALGPVRPIKGGAAGAAYWSLPLLGAGAAGNVSMTRQDEKQKKVRGGLSK